VTGPGSPTLRFPLRRMSAIETLLGVAGGLTAVSTDWFRFDIETLPGTEAIHSKSVLHRRELLIDQGMRTLSA